MSGYFAREEELRQHDRVIRRFARRVTRSEADAEDAVQEAWLRSLQHPPLAERSIVRWLRVVVSRSALRTIGRERTRRLLLREVAHSDSAPSVPCQLDERGSRERAERLIARLDEPYRTVLKLRFLEDLSPGEMAVVLQRPEVTVRSQLKRGLDRLRTRMDGQRRLASIALLFWRRPDRSTARPAFAGLVAAGVLLVGAFVVLAAGDRGAVGADVALEQPVSTVASEPVTVERESVALDQVVADALTEPGEALAPARTSAEGLVHAQGKGVAGAEIWVATMLAPPVRRLGESRLAGIADASGRFRVALEGASTVLWAEQVERGPDGAERARKGSQSYALLDLEVGACARVDVELLDLARLRGVVLDASGAPAEGARVLCVPTPRDPRVGAQGVFELGQRPAWTTADAAGRFELPVADPGVAHAWVEIDGRTVWSGEACPAEDAQIRLVEPAALEATVVGPGGQLLADCEVNLELPGQVREETTRTDGEGRVRFDDVPPGPCVLTVLPVEPGLSAVQRFECRPGETHVLPAVVVTPAASLCGRALRDGAPLAGWRVVARRPALDGMLELVETTTAADGSFEFKACRRRPHDLYLLDPADALGVPWAVQRANPGLPGVTVQLDARAPTADLYGAALGFEQPAHLSLTAPHLPAPIHRLLPASGEFELRLPPGRYAAALMLPGLGELALPEIELADGEIRFVEFQPPTTGALSVHLALPASSPRERLTVTLAGQGLASQFVAGSPAKTGELDLERGTLFVPRLLPGTYEVSVRSPGLGLLQRQVLVASAETTHMDAALEPGSTVTVAVDAARRLREGESLSFALRARGLTVEQSVIAGAVGSGREEGVYELQHSLADGEYALEVESSGGLTGSLHFTVPGESRHELQLVEPPATR